MVAVKVNAGFIKGIGAKLKWCEIVQCGFHHECHPIVA